MSADGLMAEIGRQVQRVAALSEAAGAMEQELSDLRGVGTSDDQLVSVTVDRRGFVTDITMHQDATLVDPSYLSRLVVETTQRAIGDLQAQAQQIREQLLPADIHYDGTLGERLDALYTQYFPEDGAR